MKYFVFVFVILFALSCFADSLRTAITTAALRHNVDPSLAIAIALTESNLKHEVIGSSGEQGIFQLHPRYHTTHVENLPAHIETAVIYLSSLKQQFSSKYGAAWFVAYNYGPNKDLKRPTETAYYKRVTAIYIQEEYLSRMQVPYAQ